MSILQTYQVVHGDCSYKVAATVRTGGQAWLLCLHGLQSNRRLFDYWLQSSLLSDYNIIALDLIGFGDSDQPVDFSYDIEEQTAILTATVDAIGVKRLHVMGHSLGGMVGTLMLQSLGARVCSFINVEGNLRLADCGLSKTVSDEPFELFCKRKTLDLIKAELRASKQAGANDRATWLEGVSERAFYRTCQSIVSWSANGKLLEGLRQAICPILFMYGSENVGKTACLPESVRRAEIAPAGHFMLQSEPERSIAAVKDFLSTVSCG